LPQRSLPPQNQKKNHPLQESRASHPQTEEARDSPHPQTEETLFRQGAQSALDQERPLQLVRRDREKENRLAQGSHCGDPQDLRQDPQVPPQMRSPHPRPQTRHQQKAAPHPPLWPPLPREEKLPQTLHSQDPQVEQTRDSPQQAREPPEKKTGCLQDCRSAQARDSPHC
jgi:hypothetical protein